MQYEQPIKYRRCPLCGSTTVSVVKRLRFALFDDSPLSRSFDLVSCIRCGFIYYDTKSTVDDFYRYYAQNTHYLAETCGTGASVEGERKRYAAVQSLLEKYRPDRTANIVDIGSAKGGLVSFLKIRGWRNLLAIDPLPDCVDQMKANGIEAKTGYAEHVPLEKDSAQVVILSHVLEHVVDLRMAMDELCRVVADGGLVYAEVPTIEYGSSFQEAPMWDFLFEHINYFSQQHLVSLFETRPFVCLESNIRQMYNGTGTVNCVSAIFRKHERTVPKNMVYYDMKTAVSRAVEHSGQIARPELTEIVEKKTPCYVWGISAYMQWLIADSPVGQCHILSYLDQSEYKQAKTINGIQVRSPELLREASSEKAVIFPVAPFPEDMSRYLDEIGFTGIRIVI